MIKIGTAGMIFMPRWRRIGQGYSGECVIPTCVDVDYVVWFKRKDACIRLVHVIRIQASLDRSCFSARSFHGENFAVETSLIKSPVSFLGMQEAMRVVTVQPLGSF